ncbi:MAG: hypothetical protein QOC59_251, partial [Microbacteriaceae bacterium]|nr:hypothetical protein [Microbacteriaceae bacterium]
DTVADQRVDDPDQVAAVLTQLAALREKHVKEHHEAR